MFGNQGTYFKVSRCRGQTTINKLTKLEFISQGNLYGGTRLIEGGESGLNRGNAVK